MAIFRPLQGNRTYTLHLTSLIVGAIIAVFGIIHAGDKPDMLGLAAVIAAVIGPIVGAASYNNVGSAKAEASVTVAKTANGG